MSKSYQAVSCTLTYLPVRPFSIGGRSWVSLGRKEWVKRYRPRWNGWLVFTLAPIFYLGLRKLYNKTCHSRLHRSPKTKDENHYFYPPLFINSKIFKTNSDNRGKSSTWSWGNGRKKGGLVNMIKSKPLMLIISN